MLGSDVGSVGIVSSIQNSGTGVYSEPRLEGCYFPTLTPAPGFLFL